VSSEWEFIGGTEIAKFVAASNAVDIIQGPLGSGKTKALCIRVMRHAQEQMKSPIDGVRYSRFAIVRNTVPDLVRTTIRTWLETFPEEDFGRYIAGAVKQHQVRFADVHCDVDFLSLDKQEDVRKLRSTEYTGIAFNELAYIIRDLFDEARTRLRYPGPEHGGPNPWRGVIADTNPPDEDHWLAIMTGQVELPVGLPEEDILRYRWPDSWGFYKQPPAVLERRDERGTITGYVVNPAAENLKNLPDQHSPNPGHAYYAGQLEGAPSKAWIDTRLMNRVGLFVEGQAVWPQFRREFHVAREALKPLSGHDVTVALDFGRVYPAVLFGQQIGDRDYIQYEILGFNEPASVFAPRVKRFLEQHYASCKVRFVGDPKGRDKGQQTENSSYDIFTSFGMTVIPAPVKGNDIATRTEAVAYVLNDNPSGINRLVISPACRTLIVGMAGRYHLVKEEDGELRPKKDKYSNLCDALQYWVLGVGEGRRMIGLRPQFDLKPIQTWNRRKSMRRVKA
jgi:hypothetical protein